MKHVFSVVRIFVVVLAPFVDVVLVALSERPSRMVELEVMAPPMPAQQLEHATRETNSSAQATLDMSHFAPSPTVGAEPVDPRWPRIFLLGGMKCSTSSFASLLQRHPMVCLGAGGKEPHFFDDKYHRGSKFYFRQFSRGPKNCKRMDATPKYIDVPKAPERLKAVMPEQLFPELKFIVVARDPLDRLFSVYNHVMRSCVYKVLLPAMRSGNFESVCDYFHCAEILLLCDHTEKDGNLIESKFVEKKDQLSGLKTRADVCARKHELFNDLLSFWRSSGRVYTQRFSENFTEGLDRWAKAFPQHVYLTSFDHLTKDLPHELHRTAKVLGIDHRGFAHIKKYPRVNDFKVCGNVVLTCAEEMPLRNFFASSNERLYRWVQDNRRLLHPMSPDLPTFKNARKCVE